MGSTLFQRPLLGCNSSSFQGTHARPPWKIIFKFYWNNLDAIILWLANSILHDINPAYFNPGAKLSVYIYRWWKLHIQDYAAQRRSWLWMGNFQDQLYTFIMETQSMLRSITRADITSPSTGIYKFPWERKWSTFRWPFMEQNIFYLEYVVYFLSIAGMA